MEAEKPSNWNTRARSRKFWYAGRRPHRKPSTGEILRALDIGAEGIIVPHVNTRAEAEAIVQAAHYPPIGRRGLATTTRAGRHAFSNLKEHLHSAEQNT